MTTCKYLFVGIDVSKHKHDIAILNEQKQPVHKPLVVGDDRTSYELLLNKLQRLTNHYQTQQFWIGMEATSDYWKNLYYFLKNQPEPFVVVVINPVQTKAFAKSELRRAKTDPVNARDIACYLVERRPKASCDRPLIFEAIKDVDTQMYALKKQQTMMFNKLRIELSKVAPEIERATVCIDGQKILALLRAYPTAEAIAKATVAQLHKIRYGRRQWSLPTSFIHQMKALAENSVAHKRGPGSGVVVQSLVRRITEGQQELEILKEQIRTLYMQVNKKQSVLTTIKGISKETASVLEAYIGDVNRFANAKKMVAYFGMNPVVNQSGKSKRKSYLEKKGSGIVRHKLYMVILNIIRNKQGPIYDYYARLVESGKAKLVAIGAAMRKLLTIIYAMLKTQTPFDPKKYDQSKQKSKKS
ncbi:MAG: IS110 family transposase [bacterium]